LPIIRPVSGEPDAVREKDRTKTTTKRGIRARERGMLWMGCRGRTGVYKRGKRHIKEKSNKKKIERDSKRAE